MKNSKLNMKGFTLVELTAVIIILAIILVIAIPTIGKLADRSVVSAFESNAKMVLKAVELKKLDNRTFNPSLVNEKNIQEKLNIDPSNYEKLTIEEEDGDFYITIVGKEKWANLIATGTRKSMSVYDIPGKIVRGVNAPVLAEGMKPIKWDGSAWVETTEDDDQWFDYENRIWANAVTGDCTTPENYETCSMWVWIPRYVYNIVSGWHNVTGAIDVQFSKGLIDDWNSKVTIDLGNSSNASNNKWTSHPAFSFGGVELPGFWVAKFEATAVEGVEDSTRDNVNNKTVKIIPNAKSWRNIYPQNAFIVSRNMEINPKFGWGGIGAGIDTHLIKNSEWGAVAYLSKSRYGNPEEIWNNSNNTYLTGCAGSSAIASNEAICNQYNTPDGVKASTTGNIYGIYDMAGGAHEQVSAYIDNGDASLNKYGKAIIESEPKYKNIYTQGATDSPANNYELTISNKGDAIWETSMTSGSAGAWFNKAADMPCSIRPFFTRGGYYGAGSRSGVFSFRTSTDSTTTGAWNSFGFRPVLLVNEEL